MKNIAAKLVKIMMELKYVQKTGFNSFHKYNYVSASDISKKVNESLTKHKVATFINHEVLSFESVTNNKGNQEKLAVVKVNVSFIDSESGDIITSSGLGSGQDSGDKAIMKAETAGLKYVFVQMFSIETGDKAEDPEHDAGVDERMNGRPTQPATKIALAPPVEQTRRQATDTPAPVKVNESDFNDNYDDNDNIITQMENQSKPTPITPVTPINQDQKFPCEGHGCKKEISFKVLDYSKRKFNGKALCMNCQSSHIQSQSHG